MKNLLPAVFAAFILAGCASGSKSDAPTIFEGKFIGYNNEYVEFFLDAGNGEYQEMPLNVAADGTFCDTLHFGKPLYDAALFADRFMFRVSVEPGKHYKTEFDITQDGVETNFRFIGEGEAENSFLSDFWKEMSYVDDIVKKFSSCTSFKEYLSSVTALSDFFRSSLLKIDNKPFRNYYENEIESTITQSAVYYSVLQINKTGEYTPEKEYLDYMASHKLGEQELNVFSQIVSYGYNGIHLGALMKAVGDMTDKSNLKSVSEQLLAAFVGAGNTSRLAPGLEYYQANFSDADEDIVKMCKEALSLGPGANAPDIECVDLQGNVHHLSEFAGKPLYIDLWASWCGPCRAEIPHLAKMVEALGKDPELICISISIDEEQDEWLAKVDEDKPFWPQFLATQAGQESVSKVYGVSGIPRFMLLDADGKIASVNAPRPSSPNVVKSLKELL